jgi:acyl-CoA thioesterase-1
MVDQRVLFFGDSFVAGVGDSTRLGWVGRVVARSFAAGMPLTACNLGVPRETSVAVSARFKHEASPRLAAQADCRAVFCFGANDATIENARPRVASVASLRALTSVLQQAGELGLRTLVVGPPPANDERQHERIAALSSAFAEVCHKRDVPFISVIERLRASKLWRREALAGDGAHPAAEGYEELAELVLPAWLTWLSDASPARDARTASGHYRV